jgi:hypothetical protein
LRKRERRRDNQENVITRFSFDHRKN